MASVREVCHLSKRRLFYKLQFWMWRKRRERLRFFVFRSRRHICGIRSSSRLCHRLKAERQKDETLLTHQTQKSQVRTSSSALPNGGDTGGSEDALRLQNGLPTRSEAVGHSEALAGSGCSQFPDTNAAVGTVSQMIPETASMSQNGETLFQSHKLAEKLDHMSLPSWCCSSPSIQGLEVERLSKQDRQNQNTDRTVNGKKTPSVQNHADLDAMTGDIQDFLKGFYRRYGSFIPLCYSDVLGHLRRKFSCDFTGMKTIIVLEVSKQQNAIIERSVASFRVVYKKHVVSLEDLLTLADQNWLNDQVMNMYGELIMESSHHKVHFLNSFFHRQLMTKGYDGVKRWTKQVDLFSKSLLLVPVHLEVHWCLVMADIATKKICLYDSQGNALHKVARNILKYLITEAREKQRTAFQNGWTVSLDEEVPLQTNENDCGVFVLEYSRCLALSRPFQFSQRDIPQIRKRIYKELCDCKLHEQDRPDAGDG